jgi:hypothetical protein
MEIIKEFIPYEQALALKELGFDEPCSYAWCNKRGCNKYEMIKEPIVQILKTDGNPFGLFFNGKNWNKKIIPNTKNNIQCSALLYQQAFRWFREKYGLYGIPEERALLNNFSYQVKSNRKGAITFIVYGGYPLNFKSYEEAELECLKKLIEIIKNP